MSSVSVEQPEQIPSVGPLLDPFLVYGMVFGLLGLRPPSAVPFQILGVGSVDVVLDPSFGNDVELGPSMWIVGQVDEYPESGLSYLRR
ncbi:MAG: hypothetical protein ACLFRT_13775 [Actinomycetota bacterium]